MTQTVTIGPVERAEQAHQHALADVSAAATEEISTAQAKSDLDERLANGDSTVTADQLVGAQAAHNLAKRQHQEAIAGADQAVGAIERAKLEMLDDEARTVANDGSYQELLTARDTAAAAQAACEALEKAWDDRIKAMGRKLAPQGGGPGIRSRKRSESNAKWHGVWKSDNCGGYEPGQIFGFEIDGITYLTREGAARQEKDARLARLNRPNVTVNEEQAAAYRRRFEGRMGWVDSLSP